MLTDMIHVNLTFGHLLIVRTQNLKMETKLGFTSVCAYLKTTLEKYLGINQCTPTNGRSIVNF